MPSADQLEITLTSSEHLSALRQGAEKWAAFRKIKDAAGQGQEKMVPVLNGADLADARLSGYNLQGALLNRANLSGAVLDGADLRSAKLLDANLEGANLENANLEGASLPRASLQLAGLDGARLVDASLKSANLQDASLQRANLQRANLQGANLQGANLRAFDLDDEVKGIGVEAVTGKQNVNLKDADLQGANLQGADLQGADLENCDLRLVRNLRLDGNLARGARFSPGAKDPWSVLRREYTGSRLVFHLMLLALFALPYGARTMMWLGVNRTQAAILETTAELEAATVALEARQDPNAEALRRITGRLSQVQPCLAAECETYNVWQLLLGIDKGRQYLVLALALILYNVGRGLLTRNVGTLRDEEERSGYAPALTSYRWLFWLHRVVAVLLFVAVAAFAFNAWHWLQTPVWLPL